MSIATHRVFLDRLNKESGAVVTVKVIRTHTGLDLVTAKHLWDEAREGKQPQVHATTSDLDAFAMLVDLTELGHEASIRTTHGES